MLMFGTTTIGNSALSLDAAFFGASLEVARASYGFSISSFRGCASHYVWFGLKPATISSFSLMVRFIQFSSASRVSPDCYVRGR